MRVFWVAMFMAASAATAEPPVRIAAVTPSEVRAWDGRIVEMVRDGQLRLRQVRDDKLVSGREHRRLAQYYRDVPVWGGELVMQTEGSRTVTVFGTLYQNISLVTAPGLSVSQVESIVQAMGARPFGSEGTPTLTIFPRSDGSYVLTYRLRAWREPDLRMYFIDAQSGAIVHEYNDLKTQTVGIGTGVLNDRKKISVDQVGGTYKAVDQLRPPAIRTYDFQGDIWKIINLQTVYDLAPVDLASDSDNNWTDGANVDAHGYAGWVYDYYYKRFGRRGLDDANIPLANITHPVRRDDIFSWPNYLLIGLLYMNASYWGDGLMVYGEGLPDYLVDDAGRSWNYMAGALDVVGHELTHGVTDFTSRLIYENESGALSEAISDIMGTAVEFFFQTPGDGLLRADYQMGEDVVTPGGLRSMSNPQMFGDPDHYSRRYLGTEDGGGVHINCTIVDNAYYLAVEGGTNATSGMSVEGVGSANREQMEKVFYRGFTQMLPPSATISTARAATVQSARDLYGAGSSAERAVTQAWTAVGVN